MRPHGYARYRLDGCRCYPCAYARAEYDDRRNRLIAYGRWQPYVPIAETQHRIDDLKALGYGDRSIGHLAGLGRKTIRDIAAGVRHDPGRGNPPLTKIRATTAAAIAAIEYTQLGAPDGAYVDATATWARIDDLLAGGHTRVWIAEQLGNQRALQLGRRRVTAAHARAVADLHARETGPRQPRPAATGLVRSAGQILLDIEDGRTHA
jgi:hypothetical protein